MARYIISDQHYFHKNIMTYEHRPFEDVAAMNAHMTSEYNKMISKTDICCFLGDVSWGNKKLITDTIAELNGYKILILGNHDRHKSKKFWHDVGFDDVITGGLIWDEYYMLSHEPMYLTEDMPYVNIHGHLHSKRMEDPRYFNACVELHEYKPILFTDIKDQYLHETTEI